jgi:hypothetical protein
MKQLMAMAVVLLSIIAMSSCDYDDSNDIDVIIPHDSTDSKAVDQHIL